MNTIERPNHKGEATRLKFRGSIIASCGDVDLIKDGKHFAVRYGLQLHANLTRHQAASDFGQCVLHQAQCEGRLS